MMRLLGHGDPGTLSCGSGISNTEQLLGSQMKNGVKQILRTHHEAAVAMALLTNQTAPALALLQGLAARVTSDLALASAASPPANVNPDDIVSLLLHAANTSFSDIGLVIGSCASPFRNPAGRPIVNCQRLLTALGS